MANTLILLFSILVVSILAAEGRKLLFNYGDDGICNSMVEKQGYKCEEHKVTTEDGYILSLQRMPAGQSGWKADKPPVLLQHGILSDSATWLFNTPVESLAFILADNGYDVWLANTRGTRYSNRHTSLSIDDMGTLIALAALSQGNLLNMLRSAALLSPIAHMDHIPSEPLKFVADIFLADVVYWLGLREFIPKMENVAKLLNGICSLPGYNCSDLMPLFAGQNCCVNSSRIAVFLDHEPQPTATKNLVHLSQMIRTGTIAMYNYGDEEQNMAHYGQPCPALYDMTSIPNDFPLFLSHGGQDTLSDVEDVQLLLDDLKDHDKDKLVVLFREEYAHNDFILGVNAKQVVYDPMMAFFELN
ncbi:hypothetical protein L6164_031458 [Bauhinia variegata]|uniref:Uncharacterized protein n=2 Tax=Bauhinia variegata TaxID=167791 RepID=A0ACB9LFT2_BAUVA|nr:hypothetical protein L6164_031450 [Bauhinia variegata]KAI4308377.1 hypothetical protein L6164_031458 [Bauhinia variegata]